MKTNFAALLLSLLIPVCAFAQDKDATSETAPPPTAEKTAETSAQAPEPPTPAAAPSDTDRAASPNGTDKAAAPSDTDKAAAPNEADIAPNSEPDAATTAEPSGDVASVPPSEDTAPSRADVYEDVALSIVRIKTAVSTATGFLFGSDRHVITNVKAVHTGRAVTVGTADGNDIEARIVVTDLPTGIAVLELDAPIKGATPLHFSERDPKPGDEIMVIGHVDRRLPKRGAMWNFLPRDGVNHWMAAAGVVSAVGKEIIQVDAAVSSHMFGAPVLNDRGRVVGMVNWKAVGRDSENLAYGPDRGNIQRAYNRVQEGRTFSGGFGMDGGLGGSLFVGEWGTGLGLTLALGFDYLDLMAITGHLTLGYGQQGDLENTGVVDREFFRAMWDVMFEFRFAFRVADRPARFSFGGGVGRVWDSVTDKVVTSEVESGTCSYTNGLSCPVATRVDNQKYTRRLTMPLLTLGIGEYSRITWMFDPDDTDNFVLSFTLGMGI